jgi:hypothetical protein
MAPRATAPAAHKRMPQEHPSSGSAPGGRLAAVGMASIGDGAADSAQGIRGSFRGFPPRVRNERENALVAALFVWLTGALRGAKVNQ